MELESWKLGDCAYCRISKQVYAKSRIVKDDNGLFYDYKVLGIDVNEDGSINATKRLCYYIETCRSKINLWLPAEYLYLAERSRPFYGPPDRVYPLEEKISEDCKTRNIHNDHTVLLANKEPDYNSNFNDIHLPNLLALYQRVFKDFMQRGKEKMIDLIMANNKSNNIQMDDRLYQADITLKEKYKIVIENFMTENELTYNLFQFWRYNMQKKNFFITPIMRMICQYMKSIRDQNLKVPFEDDNCDLCEGSDLCNEEIEKIYEDLGFCFAESESFNEKSELFYNKESVRCYEILEPSYKETETSSEESDVSSEESDIASEQSDDSSDESGVASDQSDESSDPSDDSIEQSDDSSEESDVASEPSDDSSDESGVASDQSDDSSEESGVESEQSDESCESSDDSFEQSDDSPEESDVASEQSDESSESSDDSYEQSGDSSEESDSEQSCETIEPYDDSSEQSDDSTEPSDDSSEESDLFYDETEVAAEQSDDSSEQSDEDSDQSDDSSESKISSQQPNSFSNSNEIETEEEQDRIARTTWCIACGQKDALTECENCPASFHEHCKDVLINNLQIPATTKKPLKSPNLNKIVVEKRLSSTRSIKEYIDDTRNLCSSCKWGPGIGFSDLVWHKLTSCPWWPAKVLTPGEIPTCLLTIKHRRYDWPIQYYGTLDYGWGKLTHMCSFLPCHSTVMENNTSEDLQEAIMDACEDYVSLC